MSIHALKWTKSRPINSSSRIRTVSRGAGPVLRRIHCAVHNDGPAPRVHGVGRHSGSLPQEDVDRAVHDGRSCLYDSIRYGKLAIYDVSTEGSDRHLRSCSGTDLVLFDRRLLRCQ
jgi:hypothetical protein